MRGKRYECTGNLVQLQANDGVKLIGRETWGEADLRGGEDSVANDTCAV